MSVTMNDMEFVHIDTLMPGQLEVDDWIEVDEEYVKIISVNDDHSGDIYQVQYENEFGEKGLIEFSYFDKIQLFMLM